MYTAMSSRPSRQPSAARLVAMPYIIVNLTGFELNIWPEDDKNDQVTKLGHGQSAPWTFQDWRGLRRRRETSRVIKQDCHTFIWESMGIGEEGVGGSSRIDGLSPSTSD